MKVVLLNDTSLYSGHFGCQIIGQVYREQFKRVGIELILSLPKYFDEDLFRTKLEEADLVVVNGEGSIHHGRNMHLIDVANRYPSVLVNCVYQDNPESEGLRKMLHISARESLSAGEIRRRGVGCDVVPDMLFASSMIRSFPLIENSLSQGIGVTDSVVKEYRRILGVKRRVKADMYAHGQTPAEYLRKLSGYSRVCAGRFHSAVACAVIGIPFSAWESNTWKTEGMMNDAGLSHLYASSREEALLLVPDEFPEEMHVFREDAFRKIEINFEKLLGLV